MGYIGQSMSERALVARQDFGFRPKSDLDKSLMEALIEDAYSFEVGKMTKEFIFKHFFELKEWHHTGKFFAKTDFYGLIEDLSKEDLARIQKDWLELKAAPKVPKAKAPKEPVTFGVASWTEWAGKYKKWRKPTDVSEFGYIKNGVFHSLDGWTTKKVFGFQQKSLLDAKRAYKEIHRGSLKGFKAFCESL